MSKIFYNIVILTVYFTLVLGEDKECLSENYCSVHPGHVLCDENRSQYSECPASVSFYNLTESQREEVLGTLNGVRSKVAKGKVKRVKSSRNTQAANMMQMRWDEKLGMAATSLAARCTDKEPCAECLLLENFSMSFVQKTFPIGITVQPLPWKIYLNQIIQEGFETIDTRRNDLQILGEEITPLDHLLWAETNLVGCGLAIYRSNESVVHRIACVFGPVGPENERQLFRSGAPCSDCPFGSQCSEKFPSLCECQIDECNLHENSERVRRQAVSSTTISTTAGLSGKTNKGGNVSAMTSALTTKSGSGITSTPKDSSSTGGGGITLLVITSTGSSDSSRPIAYSLPIHIIYGLILGSIFKF